MFPLSAISNRRPFAPSALPEFIAPMGASDFRSPPPPSSLSRLVRRCALQPAPMIGSPWLPRSLLVRLGTDSDPGVAPSACLGAEGTVACWAPNAIGLLTNVTDFGTQLLQGQHHLLPLYLASFSAYASSTSSPGCLQGSIPGPWLAATWAGFAPARLTRHCQAATGRPVQREVRPHYSTSSSLTPSPARRLALAFSIRSRKRGSFSSR